MASVDAAWLRMDEPTNLMVITAVLWFEEPLAWNRLKAVLAERLVSRFPRFRQRLVVRRWPLAGPYWEEDPAFELEAHLIHALVPGDHQALEALVSQWMSVPLDPSHPLWQFLLVDRAGRGSAILVRIHHALADGISLAQVLLSLMDERAGDRLTPERASRRLVRAAAGGATALKRLALLSPEPPTALRGELGTEKHGAWSEPIPLEELKAIGRAMGSTINDVLLAALTGALRRYLEARGGPVENLRAFIPVNLRPLDAPIPRQLGNRFGLVLLDLPLTAVEPGQRIRLLKQRMDALKRSPEAALTFAMLRLVGLAPAVVQRTAVDALAARCTLVVTNVPGPPRPVYLAGTKLTGLMFWVPQAARVGLGVSILSYADNLTVGVSADADLVPDPHRLLLDFRDELAALSSLAASVGASPASG